MTTGELVLTELKKRSPGYYRDEGNGQYRFNSPFRPNSNSNGFCVHIYDDGEHGAFEDKVSGEAGSLYDLADRLNVPRPANGTGPKLSKHVYTGLADYAPAHGATVEVFQAAGWYEAPRFCSTHKKERPALPFSTRNGERWRYIDGEKPEFSHIKGYKKCWYGLKKAADLARQTGQPLVICNGEASTVAAQAPGVAACCVTTGGEVKSLPDHLLTELKNAWQGDILVVFDCDEEGRDKAPAFADWLKGKGYNARPIDLALGNQGEDIADFCKLHQGNAAAALGECKTLVPVKPAGEKRRPKTSKDYLATLAALGYSFRMNACNDQIEVNREPMTDPIRATIRTRMRDMGYRRHLVAIEDAYIAHAYHEQYHPIKDYLTGLEWDGYPHIAELAACFQDVDNVFGKWLLKWLVGAIAKVFNAEQNSMLVLDGPQGIGKSHFVAWLGSVMPEYFIEAPINPEDKDNHIRLISKWVWEVAELGATTRRADREALKFFISQRTVTVRKPFGKYDIVKPAMASLVGTINNEAGFLTDPTGNRRFLVCELTHIDWSYTKIDPGQIWAEAYREYLNGYDWRLNADEGKRQREINNRYQVESHVMGLFFKYFDHITDPAHPNFSTWTAATDIIQKLETHGLTGSSKSVLMELAAGLKELGVEKAKKNSVSSYRGVTEKVF